MQKRSTRNTIQSREGKRICANWNTLLWFVRACLCRSACATNLRNTASQTAWPNDENYRFEATGPTPGRRRDLKKRTRIEAAFALKQGDTLEILVCSESKLKNRAGAASPTFKPGSREQQK